MRRSTIKIFSLNVIMHPHAASTYTSMLNDVFRARHVARLKGVHGGTVGSLSTFSEDSKEFVRGLFYRFVNVSPPWFDTEKSEPIVNDKGEAVHLVAKSQKSNTKEIPFIFMPQNHRMFIDRKNITPSMARDLLFTLCNQEPIKEKYGEVSVSVETSHEGVDELLAISSLRKISVSLAKPNPEGLNKYSDEVLKELGDQNAEALGFEISSRHTDGIVPSDRTKTYMYAATSLGRVDVTGKDSEGKTVKSSTDEYPRIFCHPYIKDHEPYFVAFFAGAKKMAETVLGLINNVIQK